MAVSQHLLIAGASRGIGLGLARVALDAGWDVHAVVRSLARSSELQALAEQAGARLQVIECDLAEADAGQRIAAALGAQRLDCALFNAGVYGPTHQDPQRIDQQQLAELFLLNAIAPIRLARQLAERVNDGGVIAFMSSQMASLSLNLAASMPLYGASKAALNSLLRSWSSEQTSLPWSLLALHPGWVRTDMGGANAPLSVAQSASGLLQVIERQHGTPVCTFLDYQGEALPW